MFERLTRKIRSYELGLYFRGGEFKRILEPGRHWFLPFRSWGRVNIVDTRNPWIDDPSLDVIVKSGALKNKAEVIDLKDDERALVWIDGRFARVLPRGLYALWNVFRNIRVEIIKTDPVRFAHKALPEILLSAGCGNLLESVRIEENSVGLYFLDGKFVETLQPGIYAFWKGTGKYSVRSVDLRESILDISGQDIMTADKVTLRLNALVTYRIDDPLKSINVSSDLRQSIYRDAQLALRSIVGSRDLDALLSEKDAVTDELETEIRKRTGEFGVKIVSLGIRDIILPGEMRELLNKVTEARKAAEANLITRREETAAMRSQANTARLLENNPALMRLRELEVLEKVAGNSKMSVVLGEKGLTERVVNLL